MTGMTQKLKVFVRLKDRIGQIKATSLKETRHSASGVPQFLAVAPKNTVNCVCSPFYSAYLYGMMALLVIGDTRQVGDMKTIHL